MHDAYAQDDDKFPIYTTHDNIQEPVPYYSIMAS